MERLRITVDGKTYDVVVEKVGASDTETPAPAARPAAARAATPAATPAPAPKPAAAAEAGDMPSPLAGIVQGIEVEVGAAVSEGQLILTLEAMKMYTPINAPASGTLTAIHVKSGDAVEEGQPLFTIG